MNETEKNRLIEEARLLSKVYQLLIIDDSPSDRRIYKRFIASQADGIIEVSEASTVEAGIAVCEKKLPDCVLLDYRLPDQDGLTAVALLRELGEVPVIFITGKPEPLVVTEAYRHGVVRCISKDTVTSQLLIEAVLEAITREAKHA